MDTRTGVCGRPAFCDPEKSFVKREGTWNIADRERYVVDGQAANDWTGSPGAVLHQGRRRQYKCRQRLDKMPTRHQTAVILVKQ